MAQQTFLGYWGLDICRRSGHEFALTGLEDSPRVEWREGKELSGRFCPGGATGLSRGFQPWEPQNKRVRPEGARGYR
jgi:hypothetical protein